MPDLNSYASAFPLARSGGLFLVLVGIAIAMRRTMPRGERAVVIAILFIVGLHFLPMTPAFGPIVAALGLFGMANAAVAWRSPAFTLPALWAVDGAGKLAAGAALLFSHQL